MTPVYENGRYWVGAVVRGYEVYETSSTHSTRVAQIGIEGKAGLDRAKAEADRRANNRDHIG